MKTVVHYKRSIIFDEKGIRAFATRLKQLRKELGYTQSQLAFESGISLSQIARIETARINPALSTIFSLARTMNISLCDLFNFELPG